MSIKHVRFNNEINDDSIFDLMEILENFKYENPDDEIVLHWTSEGGTPSSMSILVDYINEHPNEIKVKTHDLVGSAGLLFLLKINREVEVCVPTLGMAHLSNISIKSLETKDKNSWSTIQVEESNILDKEYMSLYEEMGLTREQLKMIEEGRDVYITSDKLERHIAYFKKAQYMEYLEKESMMMENELDLILNDIETIEDELTARLKELNDMYNNGDNNEK